MGFSIRRGGEADWAAYRGIRLRMLAESPSAYGARHADEARLDEAAWRRRAAGPMLFLAYAGHDRPVGTATGLPAAGDEVAVVAMYVDPTHRGRGCAERLLDAVAAAARDRGARRLTLHVTDGNPAAERCYTRYGFVPTGRRRPRGHERPGVEVEMALELGAPPPAGDGRPPVDRPAVGGPA